MTTAYRGFGSRIDRLFAQAERLAAATRFDEAVRAFDEAIAADPTYAHLHLYKGMALAETGQFDEAVESVEHGARLSPKSGVFPLELGCIALDEGRPDIAAPAFDRAAALDPGNRLTASYRLLTAWLLGGHTALSRIPAVGGMLPDSFKARLLVTLAIRAAAATPALPLDLSAAAAQPSSRVERRAARLVERRQFEKAVELLQRHGAAGPAARAIEARATAGGIAAVTDELRAVGGGGRDAGREKRRRDILLRLANLRSADPERQHADLDAWLASFRGAGNPESEQFLLGQVLAAMADAECRRGRPDEAAAVCQQARQAGGAYELDWVEAQIACRRGDRRTARRLFERFAQAEPLLFKDRLAQQIADASR